MLTFIGYIMTKLTEANIGIQNKNKENIVQKLQKVYAERNEINNQIKAAQWNTQGQRSAELTQILSAASPENQQQQDQQNSLNNQNIKPFAQPNRIAERISILGSQIPSSYQEMNENSRIEPLPNTTDAQQIANALAKSLENFAITTREAVQATLEAQDTVSAQILTNQLQSAEQVATALKRL